MEDGGTEWWKERKMMEGDAGRWKELVKRECDGERCKRMFGKRWWKVGLDGEK